MAGMAGLVESIVANSKTAASRLHVRSALNPMLWLCGIISLPAFALAYYFRAADALSTMLVWVGTAPIAATIIGFFYFMLFAPERLQSEDYQLRHETLQLIKTKGSELAVLPSSLEAISNPAIAALPRQGDR